MQTDIEYHSMRAMRELDLGLDAKSPEAARLHLQLSSLHLARMVALRQAAIRISVPG